jgi:hypothetical protein
MIIELYFKLLGNCIQINFLPKKRFKTFFQLFSFFFFLPDFTKEKDEEVVTQQKYNKMHSNLQYKL